MSAGNQSSLVIRRLVCRRKGAGDLYLKNANFMVGNDSRDGIPQHVIMKLIKLTWKNGVHKLPSMYT